MMISTILFFPYIYIYIYIYNIYIYKDSLPRQSYVLRKQICFSMSALAVPSCFADNSESEVNHFKYIQNREYLPLMFAIAEFDGMRERQTDFCHFCPEICVANIRAKVTTFRARLLKLIKGEKVGYN